MKPVDPGIYHLIPVSHPDTVDIAGMDELRSERVINIR
jgi:hypothetical protein